MAPPPESRPKNEPDHDDQKGLQDLDRMAAIIAGTLIQLFGDEDIDQTAIKAATYSRKKKSSAADSDMGDGMAVPSGERMMKKRRYRSIDNLYMTTKPVNFLEREKYYSH